MGVAEGMGQSLSRLFSSELSSIYILAGEALSIPLELSLPVSCPWSLPGVRTSILRCVLYL